MSANTAIITLVLMFLPFLSLSLPYTFVQMITDSSNIVFNLEFMKNDTSFAVGRRMGIGEIGHEFNGTATFELTQIINNSSNSIILGIKHSLDQVWRVICTLSEDVLVYKRNATGDYQLVQNILGSNGNKVCEISADHQFLGYGDTTGASVYQFNENTERFDLAQTFNISDIRSLDFTSNGDYFLIATAFTDVLIYNHNGTQYQLYQNITTDNSVFPLDRKVYLHDDMQYLIIPDTFNMSQTEMKIYKQNNVGQFELFQSSNYGFQSYYDHSVSADLEVMFLATIGSSYYITGMKDGVQNAEIIPASIFRIAVSDNAKYMVYQSMGAIGVLVNCDYEGTGLNYFDANTSSCVFCDEDLNMFMITENNVSTCYTCEIQNCLDCADLTTCAQCDEANGYYVDGATCSFCNESNQSYLSNGQCLSCNQENYFFENSACVECDLEGCLTCESLSVCSECDEANNYSLDEQTQTCKKEQDELLPYQIALIAVGSVLVVGTAIGAIAYFKLCAKQVTPTDAELTKTQIAVEATT